jgi:hypothetical protein
MATNNVFSQPGRQVLKPWFPLRSKLVALDNPEGKRFSRKSITDIKFISSQKQQKIF